MKSQNGWDIYTTQNSLSVLPYVTGKVHPETLVVFQHLCKRFNAEVEPITKGHSWGWAYRPIRGKTTGLSNHASGTAIDLNAPRHPLGARKTFTPSQVGKIREILKDFEGAVRWGGDYKNRADEMHFEIITSAANLAKVSAKLSGNQKPVNPTPPATGTTTTTNNKEKEMDSKEVAKETAQQVWLTQAKANGKTEAMIQHLATAFVEIKSTTTAVGKILQQLSEIRKENAEIKKAISEMKVKVDKL